MAPKDTGRDRGRRPSAQGTNVHAVFRNDSRRRKAGVLSCGSDEVRKCLEGFKEKEEQRVVGFPLKNLRKIFTLLAAGFISSACLVVCEIIIFKLIRRKVLKGMNNDSLAHNAPQACWLHFKRKYLNRTSALDDKIWIHSNAHHMQVGQE